VPLREPVREFYRSENALHLPHPTFVEGLHLLAAAEPFHSRWMIESSLSSSSSSSSCPVLGVLARLKIDEWPIHCDRRTGGATPTSTASLRGCLSRSSDVCYARDIRTEDTDPKVWRFEGPTVSTVSTVAACFAKWCPVSACVAGGKCQMASLMVKVEKMGKDSQVVERKRQRKRWE